MGCGVNQQQMNEADRALGLLRRYDISTFLPGYDRLQSLRSGLTSKLGLKTPRAITQILKIVGLSPGTITLWHDVESGWLVEARTRPGAPPVYHHVGDDIAEKILKRELTHELEEQLMTPDDYLGE